MQITKGIQAKPIKVVIYGPEGIGKSTFAAQFPDALFIDTEGSTARMDVARTEPPTSLAHLMSILTEIRANPTICRTLVLDTADWAERLCIKSVCDKYQKHGIEEFGYGKGFTYVYEEMGRILNLLSDICDAGINIVLTAHAAIRKFEQPDEMGAYDRWELKLINAPKCNVCAMVKEWADMVLFANYKITTVSNEAKKLKARSGKRTMYASHNPCWDAKNRFGLPDEMPFEYSQIAHLFQSPVAVVNTNSVNIAAPQNRAPMLDALGTPDLPQHSVQEQYETIAALDPQDIPFSDVQGISEIPIPDGIPTALADLMRANGVTEQEIQLAVSMKGYFPEDMPIAQYPLDFTNGCLIGAWDAVFGIIQSNRQVPFT